jgi:ABC-type glycerol-3-phosphate transport system permease component
MKRSPVAGAALLCLTGAFLILWTFPILWGLLTSLKPEREVLAYPPTLFFSPILGNYRVATCCSARPLSFPISFPVWSLQLPPPS